MTETPSRSKFKRFKKWLHDRTIMGRGLIWTHRGTSRFLIAKNDDYECPKCGGDMHKEIKLMSVTGVTYPAIEWWICDNPECGHEEKVTDGG